jgi:hypothetical protein
MPEPVPLDYQRNTMPRQPRSFRVFRLLVVFVVLWFVAPMVKSALNPPRVISARTRCSMNLSQIGLAISLYCRDNNQQFPSDLAALLLTEDASADMFICPASTDFVLPDATAQQQAATLLSGRHCSFIYVGAGMTSATNADALVAFELPDNHGKSAGGNVLHAGGYVTWLAFEDVVQLVGELEAGHNPPVIQPLTPAQAWTLYKFIWEPKLPALRNGAWAASLPRPATQPATAVTQPGAGTLR